MDFDQVADELYALPPSRFTAARDTAVGQARAVGAADLAARLKALRRPTLGAWLANLLVREHPKETRTLLELGAGLRAAQDALDGQELRELTAQRRAVVAGLARQARQAAVGAGRSVGEGPLQELEEHLQAVLVDRELADAFATGRLVTTQGPGARAPAAPTGSGRPPEARSEAARGGTGTGTGADARRGAVRAKAAQLQGEARRARTAAAAARRDLERATAQRQRIQRRIDDLAERLDRARDQERQAARAERTARATVEATDRAARKAEGYVRDTAAHLRHLDDHAA